jgi:quinol monooxygenase YgiN
MFMVVFMGGMAGGSALWGQLATDAGIPMALMVAAVGTLLALAATWMFRLGGHDDIDLAPSMHWPAPPVATEPEGERGPVMVMIEYRIDPVKAAAFIDAMQDMRRMRRRGGAFFWKLFNDAEDPARFIETFLDESWLEHLRQHERVTVDDRAIQERVAAFHVGGEPPRVSHLLARQP